MVKITINKLDDPYDTTLRKVESDVKVPQLMREITRTEKCPELVKAYSDCCKREGPLMSFNCRKELNEMKACMEKWYNDEGFRQECTQMYLEKRKQRRLELLNEKIEEAKKEREKQLKSESTNKA